MEHRRASFKELKHGPVLIAPHDTAARPATSSALRPRTRSGFFHIYGWLGIPIMGAFLLSAAWTMALAVIQLIPTSVANALMDTGQFDYGEFWLLPKPDYRIAIPAAVALASFSVGYIALVVLMLFPDKVASHAIRQAARAPSRVHSLPAAQSLHRPPATENSTNATNATNAVIVATRLGSHEMMILSSDRGLFSIKKRLAALAYDPDSGSLALPKLIIQTMTLVTYLNEGFPVPLIYTYSVLLLVNWILTSYRLVRQRPDPHYILIRVAYSFDLFFAVLAPLHVLVFSYNNFVFDRTVFAIRIALLPVSSFDRTARLFADPTQISLFRIAFQHLQLTTVTRLLLKCALNAFTIAKWHHLTMHLVQLAALPPPTRRQSCASQPRFNRWERSRRIVLAVVFFFAGLGIFAHSIVAVASTLRVCKSHTQCKVPSYQWNIDAQHCSCIVFVDRETRVRPWAEWLDPPSTTQELAALAYTGHLKIIQVINRQLPAFPEELRRCRHLEQLILIYTKTLAIPDWAKEFVHLEYLHIEGDLTPKRLASMPRDLFVATDRLLFLHLGSLTALPFVPDLNHLVRLEYLVLAMLHSITELPDMDALVNLKRLNIVDNIALVRLPRVGPLRQLVTFALANRVPACCNGFLPGGCNLTAPSCLDRSSEGESRVQCTTERYPLEDYKTLIDTQGPVCAAFPVDLKNTAPTVVSVDKLCGGVLYKQCTLGGRIGICYPARMMAVACSLDPNYTAMRRLEIQRRIGDPCDPVLEKWLNCEPSSSK